MTSIHLIDFSLYIFANAHCFFLHFYLFLVSVFFRFVFCVCLEHGLELFPFKCPKVDEQTAATMAATHWQHQWFAHDKHFVFEILYVYMVACMVVMMVVFDIVCVLCSCAWCCVHSCVCSAHDDRSRIYIHILEFAKSIPKRIRAYTHVHTYIVHSHVILRFNHNTATMLSL